MLDLAGFEPAIPCINTAALSTVPQLITKHFDIHHYSNRNTCDRSQKSPCLINHEQFSD